MTTAGGRGEGTESSPALLAYTIQPNSWHSLLLCAGLSSAASCIKPRPGAVGFIGDMSKVLASLSFPVNKAGLPRRTILGVNGLLQGRMRLRLL